MLALSVSPGRPRETGLRAKELFERHLSGIARRTDRFFSGLLAFQWIAAVATALLYLPGTSAGEMSRVHAHVWAATLLGGVIVGLPIALALFQAGATSTRHVIAVAQALMGALLIHLSGGRIETHIHVFGSLALLAYYRDWRVLVTASAVVALDHLIRGFYWPQSVFGVLAAIPWRWAEHAGWVVIEDVFLIRSCLQNVREMRDIADREADLSRANEVLAREVVERQRAEEAQARMVALLEATTDFVGIADAGGRALYVNAAGLSMVGLTAEDVPRTVISDYYPAWANELLAREALPAAIRDGVWSGEVALLRRDGGEIPVSTVIVSHKDSHGNIESFSTIARDVTEQKQAEWALLRAHEGLESRVAERTIDLSRANEVLAREVVERQRAEEAQARMVALLEATTDFVGIADAGGRALYVNAAGLSMVGLTAEDVPRTVISDYHPAWANELLAREALPAAVRDGVWSGETTLLRRDGGEIPVSTVIVSHKDSHGNIESFSTIARDVTERKRTEQQIRLLNSQLERRLGRLNALRRIDTAITFSFDLGVTLSTLLDQVISQLGVDAADVLLLDPRDGSLQYANSRGFHTNSMKQVPLRMEQSVPGRVASECVPFHLSGFTPENPPFVRAEAMKEEGFVAYSAVPLVSQGTVKGVLEVFHRAPLEVDEEWLDFLGVLAGQAAIAIDSARLFEDLQRSNAEMTVAYDATIEGWSRALDLRDKETEGHTHRVTEMSVRLARAMGITGADLINVRRGALLHDVGKLGVPDAILLKPGKLTEEEWAVMRRHPTYAYEWLAPIDFLRPALEIPYCHHEKWDGTGYPHGLRGEEIPLAARAFAAVDIWDALRSDRPYRKGWPDERVIEHIRSLSGTHLDPGVVDAFLRCLAGAPTVAEADDPDAGEALAGSLPDESHDTLSVGRNGLSPAGQRGF